MNNEAKTATAPIAIPASERFLTKSEVALRLSKTTRTVELWSKQGILPRIKVGRSVLFDWEAVKAAINARQTGDASR